MSHRASKVSRKLGRPESGTKRVTKSKIARRTAATRTTKGRTQRTRAVKRDELELEPITPFGRGLSIGVKMAGLTACVVGLFMGLLGYLTYSISAQNIHEQITEQGLSIVDTLEQTVDRGFWVGREAPIDPAVPPEDRPPARDPEQVREDLLANWQLRLEGLVTSSGGKIVAVSVIEKLTSNATRQELVVQHPRGELRFEDPVHLKTDGEVEIFEGSLQSKRVRRFDKPIALDIEKDQQITKLCDEIQIEEPGSPPFNERLLKLKEMIGKDFKNLQQIRTWRDANPPAFLYDAAEGKAPWVSVFVRAERLDQVKAALFNRIAIVTLCGAVAGIMLTVLIAAVLTRPIRELEQDIGEVAGGNLLHQSRVSSTDEIGGLAHVFNIMTRNLSTAQNNAVERKAFERELNIAKEIQEKLLPERIPQIPGFDIHSHYKSAKEVGGDYYDFIVIDQTHLGIIVADVAGKGIPGAMVMTMARSLVRLASVRNVSPGDTFKKVNRILAKDIRRGMFVTAAYMVLNVKTRVLRVASAGHNPVVLYRAATGQNELIKPAGIALGFDKGTIFDNHVKEVEVELLPGDRIVTYTDGVNEAMDNNSEEFGEDRFFELVRTHAGKSSQDFVAAVVEALDAHRGTAEQSDDITITTLSVSGGATG